MIRGLVKNKYLSLVSNDGIFNKINLLEKQLHEILRIAFCLAALSNKIYLYIKDILHYAVLLK